MRKLISLTLLLMLALVVISPVNAFTVFSDDFERQELGSDWNVVKGAWTIESGELSATGIEALVASGQFLVDFSVQVRMKIAESAGVYDWIGIVARTTNPADDVWDSGYLVYLREDGRIELYTLADGIIASANTGADTSDFVTVKADFFGTCIKVYVDGTLYINADDDRYSAGYFSLKCYVTEGRFDDVLVENSIPPHVIPEPASVVISLLFITAFGTYALIRYRKPTFKRRI